MNLTNNFLVSLPTANSGQFNRSVILLTEHTGDGASGWMVNKQLDDKISVRLRKGMGLQRDIPLYYGGPVEVNNAVVIHSNDLKLPSTRPLNEHLSYTRDKSIVNVMNIGQFPEYWRVIVGRSAWGAGQLESELLGSRTNGVSGWLNLDYTNQLMWNTLPSKQWETSIELSAQHMTSNILKTQKT
jgi:putative transcriptional regulator|tara:strand:+ start:147 stop:701 length:555 start_codon:yes stop_codon:yes gene_type:complete